MKWFTRSFLVLVAVFLLAEIGGRLFFARGVSGRFDYGYHPTAGFVEHKDGRVSLVRAGGRRFFPQSFQKEKSANTLRIMTLGDSVPRGPSLGASYPVQLQKILQERGISSESFNLGLPGYGARRVQVVLQQALRYQPDILMMHLYNGNEYEDEREWQRAVQARSWHPSQWLKKSFVLARLHETKIEQIFWKWLPETIRIKTAPDDFDAKIASQQDTAQQTIWRERLIQVHTQSLNHALDQTRVLVILPAVLQKQSDGSRVLGNADFPDFVSNLHHPNLRLLSMVEVFSGKDTSLFSGDGVHLTAEGHRLLAQAIAQRLADAHWVK